MTEVTLEPCPFCGGKADRFTIEEPGDNFGGDVISCTSCGASSHVEFGRKENLVSRWNTRPASAEPADALAEAREALALARNRLQACAVEATVRAMPQSYEWAVWAADVDAALSRLNAQGEKP